MEFRPCIDIHNGKVKQIVGGSLKDRGDFASENFVSEQDSRFYADMYRKSGIKGGHIILLNSVDSEYYEDTKEQAVMALEAYPQGLQVGGGITADNAMEFIDAVAAGNLEKGNGIHGRSARLSGVDKADKQNANPKHVEEYI